MGKHYYNDSKEQLGGLQVLVKGRLMLDDETQLIRDGLLKVLAKALKALPECSGIRIWRCSEFGSVSQSELIGILKVMTVMKPTTSAIQAQLCSDFVRWYIETDCMAQFPKEHEQIQGWLDMCLCSMYGDAKDEVDVMEWLTCNTSPLALTCYLPDLDRLVDHTG